MKSENDFPKIRSNLRHEEFTVEIYSEYVHIDKENTDRQKRNKRHI